MAIKVSNLVKRYGDFIAVDDLSFAMDEPGVFGLLGTNGAGKTTTIRMMLGMLKKDGGNITWNGEKYSPNKISTGYLAEERGIYNKSTIIDQLIYFAELKGVSKKEAKKRIDYWLEKLQITEHKNKKAEQLSKGNQQKVQFIAALISDPDILILDEPLSGLDPVNTDLFKEIIKEEIEKKKYIIMSSHQMSTIEEFCTSLVILDHGKTVLKGNLSDIKKSYGRSNLILKCDGDISNIIKESNMTLVDKNIEEYIFKIKDEKEANEFLKLLLKREVSIIKFELREPTLHEIFIEKVGN
ncbi:ABC transporter ATP-binding protein [Clostridium fallax]|uniref:ABC-2 type transport system ATP-binding protein n=2 Tax=Clostridium fallax TaxID=1533 RepID=A0A1M4WF34_9CLOT|nr:ATP-binding cassette domain-containing protein [Clostridium fallax]SHE79797.1 ABC-2 type transport system ATP-binding protein [Clostridium fallax]SQB04937.1 ABC transporter [Clostridium fallax]